MVPHRANGHANGINGTYEHGSSETKGPPRRLPASDDPLDDLEDGPLLSDPGRSASPICPWYLCDLRGTAGGSSLAMLILRNTVEPNSR